MKTNIFEYNLPTSYIAQYPLKKRSNSKLLFLEKKTGNTKHLMFKNIYKIFKKGDLIILNNTKVIPVKIVIENKNKKICFFIEKILNNNEGICQIKNKKKEIKISIDKINLMIKNYENNIYKITCENITINELIDKFGKVPLPPYIKRESKKTDNSRYKTIYEKTKGSIAAPTAGLHFDKKLIHKIKKKGINIGYITLHIGSGTFKTIKSQNIDNHKMHLEYVNVSKKICKKIEKTKKSGNKVIACGTSTVRAIETAAINGKIKPFNGNTNIFIKPGFVFKVTDSIITNFHLPRSPLLILISTFYNIKLIIKSYEEAKKKKYRFLSYGDAMLIY